MAAFRGVWEHVLDRSIESLNIGSERALGGSFTTSEYMRQKLIELWGEINKPTIIVEYFNILLSIIDRASRQKISKDTVELNGPASSINWISLIFIDYFIQQ